VTTDIADTSSTARSCGGQADAFPGEAHAAVLVAYPADGAADGNPVARL
jgi:hypothetical protein